jgi:peptide/nickel transport system permease protein
MRLGLGMLAAILLASFLVPALSPYTATDPAGVPLTAPGAGHPFGTDNLGRDVFVRTFAAARLDIGVALLGVSIPLVLGTAVGAVLGMTRQPLVSGVARTIMDAINAFPLIALIIGLIAVLGVGLQSMIVALALTNWARYARIARTRALVIREQDYIQATTVLGYSRRRVLGRHVLPNVSAETTAYALSDFVLVIILVAGLSFLGLGVRPPAAEWGAMMSDGRLYLQQAWWITVFPGLMLSLTGIAVALIAEGVRRRQRGEQ